MIEAKYTTRCADHVLSIPQNQRFYSWQAHQREDVFSDLEKLAKLEERERKITDWARTEWDYLAPI